MATATLTLSASAPAGWKYTIFVDPNISDTPSVAFNQSPAVAAGDIVVFRKWALIDAVTTSYSVTISTNGMPTVYSGSDSASLSFLYFFWDNSTSDYGTTATYNVLAISASAGGTYLPVGNIWQWIYQTEPSTGSITDKIQNYLAGLGYTGAVNEALYNWLGSVGYTGTLAERISQFERVNTARYG